MSKLMLQPNYCRCTVNQARNLPNKGKQGGVDAFCTISMGKEKFVTAVREKTQNPEWQEECEMPIVDDAKIKLTVYHNNKNALSKGDFIGRAYISLRDLSDYDRVHRRWYKLLNKDEKADKERGEIDVSLQFYSQNNTTGSVLDLATKKKHLSLKDIKHSLGGKLKSASKHRKQEPYGGENQSASFAGSHMSLNSMSYNNQPDTHNKKMPRATSSGFGSNINSGTPYSSRRSVTSDYDTSSILDSASMYGGDEPSTSSPPVHSQIQQQQQQTREVYVGDELPPRSNSMRKKSREPPKSSVLPSIVTSMRTQQSPPANTNEQSRSFSVTGDDIEAAFDAINDYKTSMNESSNQQTKDHDLSSPDSLFGLSTIQEAIDHDEMISKKDSKKDSNRKQQNDRDLDEIDFDDCFEKYKPQISPQAQIETKIVEEKPFVKSPAPVKTQVSNVTKQQESTPNRIPNETKRQAPIHVEETRPSSVTITTPKIDMTPTLNISAAKSTPDTVTSETDDPNDFNDNDVDELLGKLERISSMRSSVRRKIQPKVDPMQQSYSELDSPGVQNFTNGFELHQRSSLNQRIGVNGTNTLPDIVGEQTMKSSIQNSSLSTNSNRKPNDNGLYVLGYDNVKSVPIQPKVRQELDYLDREELLHVIAYQTDLLKKRDTRLKDLENYTDSLLVKILEQCPTILQVGPSSAVQYR